MGYIVGEAKLKITTEFPEQGIMLKPFLCSFDVTYAERKEINNTVLFAFILKPEKQISEGFGIDKEILLAYSPYKSLEQRSLQALNKLFNVFPFSNRIDTLSCFFISQDESVKDYSGVTSFGEEQSRSIVTFVYDELIKNQNDPWYIRNMLKQHFYDEDLFGYTLPLRDDASFFGRQQVISRYIDSIKRCENRGIFGVRKTGKTSLMFRIDRIVREQKLGFVFYYDCKSPSYRKMHWNEFLGSICDNIAKRLKIRIKRDYDEKRIIQSFRYVMKVATDQKMRIIIMFDEVEYISFRSPLDDHWHTEFIDFWQTIWSVQSIYRNLVFILAGVNPSIVETDIVNGVQNPLFSIVQSEYLQGLTNDDARLMIRTLGRRMGLSFEYDAINALYDQYNGHPMLLRLACSYINRSLDNTTRPVKISLDLIKPLQSEIDIELSYYFRHVVSEIKQFYPEEYEMFELLASGQTVDFIELSSVAEYTKHLYSYGLVAKDEKGIPYVKMPVAGRYVAMELAKKEHRTGWYKIIEKDKRDKWVSQRIQSIIRDMRLLEMAIARANKPKLFGANSFPEAEKFAALKTIKSSGEYNHFFNVCSKCFVESIENYGKDQGNENYFRNDIKASYPALFEVLRRIKIYRHHEDHLELKKAVSKDFSLIWNEDTEGVTDPQEQLFVVQQRILDGLMSAIQIEIDSLE